MIRKGIDYSYCWLQLELTDYCNLSCSMCLSGNSRELLNIDTPHMIWGDSGNYEVEICFEDPSDYEEVFVIGDFNYWGILEDQSRLSRPTVEGTEMSRTEQGWSKKIDLPAGKYRFAFLTRSGEDYQWKVSEAYPLALHSFSELPVSYLEVGEPKSLRRGFMSCDLVRKILEDLKKNHITLNEISPFWFGESMVHPDFREIIGLISGYNREYNLFDTLGLHTNALLMDEEISDLLISSGKDFPGGLKISFSLDAFSQETYQKIRRGGNFREAVRNVKYFLTKASNSRDILSVIQFIVQQENFQESEEFYRYWDSFFRTNGLKSVFRDSFDYTKIENGQSVIFFRPLDNTLDSRRGSDELFEISVSSISPREKGTASFPVEESAESRSYICSSPWRSLFVQWNGQATVCCADTFSNLSIGNLEKDDFDHVWHDGPGIIRLRKHHLQQDFKAEFLRCRYCPQWKMACLSDDEKKLYLDYMKGKDV